MSLVISRSHLKFHHGDCTAVLPTIADQSVDAVITDPPYPEIDRPYGRLTEKQWAALMQCVVKETRRILKPSGSAVFIIQPNSEKVGRMRTWIFEFQLWIAKSWNIVQDVYWYNPSAMPTVHCNRDHGLMRQSVKLLIWCGPSDCYRRQDEILLSPSQATKTDRRVSDDRIKHYPSSHRMNQAMALTTHQERGGVTPYNLLVVAGGSSRGHSAETPFGLCDWWCRYLTPKEGVVLDPFAGSGTVGEAALDNGFSFIGIEQDQDAVNRSISRLEHLDRQETMF